MRQNLTISQQDQINLELLDAAKNGNMQLCQTLLEQGANPNIKDGWKNTALHYAAEKDYTAMCFKLLETIEDINLQGCDEMTFLHYAAMNGNFEFCEALITNGANPNITDRFKKTAFYYAAVLDHDDICLKLFENIGNVDLDGLDSDGRSLLHYAALNNNFEFCEVLINNGANPNVRDGSQRTALHYATKNNHTVTFLKLLEIIDDVNLQDAEGKTPLHGAAMNGSFEFCEALINKGANPNIKDDSERAAFHYAAKNNYTYVCLKLLETIEDVNLQDRYKKTALHYAVLNNNIELAGHLISEGANIPDDLSNSISADIRTEANSFYQAKLDKEESLIKAIRQQVQEYLTDKLIVTLAGDALADIFAAIKEEIKGEYCDADKIENLYKILGSYLKDIENNDGVTTGRFKHFFRKNLLDFTEWSINMRVSYMTGPYLDDFQMGNVSISGDVMSHVKSLVQVSPRDANQEAINELGDYMKDLSQKYKDKEIIVRDKFFSEVILPLGKRQNLPGLEPRQETDPSITPAIPKEQSRSQTIENEQAEVEDVVSSMVQAVVDRSNVGISSQL